MEVTLDEKQKTVSCDETFEEKLQRTRFEGLSMDSREGPRKSIICDETFDEKVKTTRDPTINPSDVLCGREKTSFNHVGNRRFRDAVRASIDKYNQSQSRFEKSIVVNALMRDLRSKGGRFMKKDKATGKWVELDNRRTIEKVGHAIRDAASLMESKGQKRKRRKSPSFGRPDSGGDVDVSALPDFSSSTAEDDFNVFGNSSISSLSSTTSDTILMNPPAAASQLGRISGGDDDFLSVINDVLGPMPVTESPDDLISQLLAEGK